LGTLKKVKDWFEDKAHFTIPSKISYSWERVQNQVFLQFRSGSFTSGVLHIAHCKTKFQQIGFKNTV